MNKKLMLHHLRSPDVISETEFHKARLQAIDELERLYKVEKRIQDSLEELKSHGKSLSETHHYIPIKSICPHCSIDPCACELHG